MSIGFIELADKPIESSSENVRRLIGKTSKMQTRSFTVNIWRRGRGTSRLSYGALSISILDAYGKRCPKIDRFVRRLQLSDIGVSGGISPNRNVTPRFYNLVLGWGYILA